MCVCYYQSPRLAVIVLVVFVRTQCSTLAASQKASDHVTLASPAPFEDQQLVPHFPRTFLRNAIGLNNIFLPVRQLDIQTTQGMVCQKVFVICLRKLNKCYKSFYSLCSE